MNKVILIGRMTKDAEVRRNNEGTVARFTLAVDRRFKSGDQNADFISCISFGKTAEFLETYGHKGVKFAIEGRIQTGSYTNKDGQRVYTTDVVVENVEFAESKNTSQEQPKPSSNESAWMNINSMIDEELPFR